MRRGRRGGGARADFGLYPNVETPRGAAPAPARRSDRAQARGARCGTPPGPRPSVVASGNAAPAGRRPAGRVFIGGSPVVVTGTLAPRGRGVHPGEGRRQG